MGPFVLQGFRVFRFASPLDPVAFPRVLWEISRKSLENLSEGRRLHDDRPHLRLDRKRQRVGKRSRADLTIDPNRMGRLEILGEELGLRDSCRAASLEKDADRGEEPRLTLVNDP